MIKKKSKRLISFLTAFFVMSLMIGFQYAVVFAEEVPTFYIDPSSTVEGTRDGSLEKPFASWDEVVFVAGNIYLQKRGTTAIVNNKIAPKSDIIMGAYGDGEKPVIISNYTGHAIDAINTKNVTIKDLEITAPKALSGIQFSGLNSGNQVLDNLIIRDAQWGIRLLDLWSGIKVLNTEIYNIGDDGIYAKSVSRVEVGYSYIHDINQKYNTVGHTETQAPGDNIQLSVSSDGFYIHHNILDHSSTGNKFAVIVHGDGNDSGIIEYNHLIGQGAKGFAAVYIDPTMKNVTVRNNIIENSGNAVYSLGDGLKFYNNIVNYHATGLYYAAGTTSQVYNNTFYNVRNALKHMKLTNRNTAAADVTFKNNITVLTNKMDKYYKIYDYTTNLTDFEADYNLVYPERAGFIEAKWDRYNNMEAWRNATGNDTNTIVGDPKFKDAVKGDFTLMTGSPAIGLGANVEEITNTLVGVHGSTKLSVKYNVVVEDPANTTPPTPITSADVLTSKVDFTEATSYIGTGVKGIYTMEYDVTPLFDKIDGVMGYTDDVTLVSEFASLPIAVVMTNQGVFSARNGGAFGKIADVMYSANKTYHVKVVADLKLRTYDVFITPEGGEPVKIAEKFAFRSDAFPPSNIGQITLRSGLDGQFTVKNHKISMEKPKAYEVTTNFNLSTLEAGKLLQANVQVTSQTNVSEPIIVIAALYDKNNIIVKLSYISKVVNAGATEILSAGFELPYLLDNHTVKVFTWKGSSLSSSSMVPISNAVTLK
jgi:hypothetical protein